MSTVYVVVCYHGPLGRQPSIKAIFSSKEKAEHYEKECYKAESSYEYEIIQMEVDSQVDYESRPYWTALIDLKTGELESERIRYALAKIDWDTYCVNNMDYPTETGYIPLKYSVSSFKSQEHANSLVLRAREEFLKRVDLKKIKSEKGYYRYLGANKNHPDFFPDKAM